MLRDRARVRAGSGYGAAVRMTGRLFQESWVARVELAAPATCRTATRMRAPLHNTITPMKRTEIAPLTTLHATEGKHRKRPGDDFTFASKRFDLKNSTGKYVFENQPYHIQPYLPFKHTTSTRKSLCVVLFEDGHQGVMIEEIQSKMFCPSEIPTCQQLYTRYFELLSRR